MAAGLQHQAVPLSAMPGMWRRSRLTHADGAHDTTSQVRWLQAQRLFVELRQAAALPDFLHLRCLNGLTAEDCTLLAVQEGFAGHLDFDGACCYRQRLIDFQPRRLIDDTARLCWEDELLIAAGRDVPYVEYWMRDPTVVTRPLAAMRLRERATGVAALVVQVGTVFMFARDRGIALTAGATLRECIAGAACLADARAMLDCEITLGSAGFGAGPGTERGNVILASTHPWRVNELFQLVCTDASVRTVAVDPTGEPLAHHWEVMESEGDPGAVWPGR